MLYEKRKKENKKVLKKKKRKLLPIFIVLLLIISITVAVTLNIMVTWIVPSGIPSVVLEDPADNSFLSSNPVWFNWTATDGEGDLLTNVWYADILPTFTSPFRQIVNVNTNQSYNASFDDGEWYWKVEVTDNDGLNTSEVWNFTMGVNGTNTFPSLSNTSLSPSSGTTSTTFYYNVTYTDLDNNSASYIRVYINGSLFSMVETDPSDINTTDGKNYSYSTTMPVGTHNYTFTCSDGDAVNTTVLYIGPTVTSTAPVQSGEVPADSSTNIPLLPSLYVLCTDVDNDSMNATWYSNSSGSWLPFGSNSSFSNNTNISQTNSNFSAYSTTYWWSVNITDGISWTNETYSFTTRGLFFNSCPEASNPSPSNQSMLVSIHVGYWNITILDNDGNTTSGSIECSSGNSTSWNSQPNGTRSLEINQTLTYNTVYYIWLNFTDGNCTVNKTYWFRTNPHFSLSNENPLNESTDECPNYIFLCLTVYSANSSTMNLTFYSNVTGTWEPFYINSYPLVLRNITNGEYCIYVHDFMIFDHTYYWNASLNDGTAVFESDIFQFETTDDPTSCLGGSSSNSSWILGVAILFSIFGIMAYIKQRKRGREE